MTVNRVPRQLHHKFLSLKEVDIETFIVYDFKR